MSRIIQTVTESFKSSIFVLFSRKKPDNWGPTYFNKRPTTRAGWIAKRAILHHATAYQMTPNFQDLFVSPIGTIYRWKNIQRRSRTVQTRHMLVLRLLFIRKRPVAGSRDHLMKKPVVRAASRPQASEASHTRPGYSVPNDAKLSGSLC